MSSTALAQRWLAGLAADRIAVIDCPLAAHVVPGQLDARNGRAVLQTLDLAIDGAQRGRFEAIVTAPLQKSTINDAGVPFTGHTEYLAEQTGTPQVVMMLAGASGPAPHLAGGAGHHPSGAEGGTGGDHFRQPAAHAATSCMRDLQRKFGLAQPAHPGDRPESACRRGRLPGTRGNRRDRAGAGGGAARRASMPAARIRPIRCSSRNTWSRPIACWRCTTTRACRC